MRAALILGAVNGLGYALLAVGLVVTHKASRFVNLAHAQLGVISALLLAKLVVDLDWSWFVAFPVCVAIGSVIGALAYHLVIQRLRGGALSRLVASLGISQILLALAFVKALGPNRVRVVSEGYPLPFDVSVTIDALVLRGQHLLTIALVPVLTLALILVLRKSAVGRAIRAAASNPDAARLAGISVRRVGLVAWLIAGGLSAVSAILLAPGQATFDVAAMAPALLLRALGAAAVSGFNRIETAFAAGVSLGVAEAAVLQMSGNAGTAELAVLVLIIGGLLARRGGLDRERGAGIETTDQSRLVIPPGLERSWLVRYQRAGIAIVGAVTAVLLPFLPLFRPESKQFLLTLVVVYAIVAVSLTILTGWGGQVSLGHFAFIGVGAYTSARLVPGGWSLLATMFVAGITGAAVAVIVGVPALRLPGLTLAVPTLGLALVAPAWLFTQTWFGQTGSIVVAAPSLAGIGAIDTTRGTYFLSVAVLALTIASASAYRRSRAGRLLVAVRDNAVSVAAYGISPTSVKLGAFALSGFIASVAGVLWVAAFRNVSTPLFGAEQSLLMLSIVVIGGLGSLAGSVLGSALIFGVPTFASDLLKSIFPNTLAFTLFLSGLGLVLTQLRYPGGLATTFRTMWQRLLYAVAAARESRALDEDAAVPLRVRDVNKAFGGVAALAGATITVHEGEIVGLIGSNGAGKSTLMDVISGFVKPDSGTVEIFGREMSDLPAEVRAHVGVGRGFQEAALFPGLTVLETIQVALARTSRVSGIAAAVGAPWARRSERRTRHRAEELLARFGLEPWKDVVTAQLSTGTRRICDLAAQAAGAPRLLLLDEPTAGVAQRDAEAFGPLLRRLRDEFDCSVLLVEHDMPLLLGLADRVYCLERGVVIAEGTAEEIRRDPAVIASYLGTTPVASERSGGRTPSRRQAQKPLVGAAAPRSDSTEIARGDD